MGIHLYCGCISGNPSGGVNVKSYLWGDARRAMHGFTGWPIHYIQWDGIMKMVSRFFNLAGIEGAHLLLMFPEVQSLIFYTGGHS
jgi:hypothetical protein